MGETLSRSPLGREPLPASLQAEQAVLGLAMAKPDSLNYSCAELAASDFYHADNMKIFETVLRLFMDNKPVDLISITDDLEKRGILNKVGGVSYLSNLVDTIPFMHNDRFYVDLIKEKSRLRQLIGSFHDLTSICYGDSAEFIQIVDLAAERLFKIREGQASRQFFELGQVIADQLNVISAMGKSGTRLSLRSGFAKMDQILGGLRKGSLLILAARPGMGKSALALNIAQRATQINRLATAVFSLEMSKEEVATRLLASEMSIDSRKFQSGQLSEEEWTHVSADFASFYEMPIFIDDHSGLSPLEMLSRCRELKLKRRDLGLVIVDYLQLMSSSRQRQDNRQQEISDISRNLKIMARELNLPVIALSQLSRACEARVNKRPMLSDLRDSGAIEQDADAVLFLYRDDYYKDEKSSAATEEAELIVAKNRHGATDTIKMGWRPQFMQFFEEAHERDVGEAPPF